ncbi:MAG: FprA family A-type flavoprotein, partial [Candidatus Marinimicrobia bacterium]|nr:FprA family A-type flavoprotein [Candidatus Neomarinimicrobiota bacterium]
SLGAKHWDRRIFDELVNLPKGTTYNSFVVQGSEKTALIDTVDPEKTYELITNLKEANIDKIDFIVANHAEQDHSGSIPKMLEMFPEAKVVTNKKCQKFLNDLLPIPDEKFLIIDDGETLSLGDKTLKFTLTPWVHWPETMVTYAVEDKVLFTCDFFGSHYASSSLFVDDECEVYESAKRYYAEIMMPFRRQIQKNLEKVSELEIDMIAASHGPIYDKPNFIIDAYKDWVSDEVKNEVILPYISMHGSTKKMVDYLIDAFTKKGIKVKPFNLTKIELGVLAIALVDAASVIVATPTVLAGAHPVAVQALFLTNALRPKLKFASMIGSYNWGGKTVQQIKDLLKNLKVEFIPEVNIKGDPTDEDFKLLDKLVDEIYEKHKELGLI